MVSCDFCGKNQNQVEGITISNIRPGVAICIECAKVIVAGEDTPKEALVSWSNVDPSPFL